MPRQYMLKSWGYRWLKCGSLPAKANTVLQRQFFENTLEPAMNDAKDGKCHLFFMDAAHFIYGCEYLGRLWTKVRRFVRTATGGERYNVLGALDYATKVVEAVTT